MKLTDEDVREDVYGVFVRVQDEQHALSQDYAKFAASIHTCIKEQLAQRDKIDAHLAEKTRNFAVKRHIFATSRQAE